MLSISSIFSVGAEKLYPGSDYSHGAYLDELNDFKTLSVSNVNLYRSRETYEISGFYSDEEEDDTKPLSSQPYYSPMQVEENLDHMAFSTAGDVQPGYQTSRKRSFTNLFKARPETTVALNSSNQSCSPPKSNCDATFLNNNSNPPSDPSTIRQPEQSEISLKEIKLNNLPTLSQCAAPHTFLAKPSYLSQARRNLTKKSINRRIAVGVQPRASRLTAQEQNECFQKIWTHQQNRIEAHRRMTCVFDQIPEEEES